MLLCFEQQIFLPLDYVFSYYNKDTQGDHREKYCLLFLPLKCVISTYVLSKMLKYAEAIAEMIYNRFC